jgi:hypothetical protein
VGYFLRIKNEERFIQNVGYMVFDYNVLIENEQHKDKSTIFSAFNKRRWHQKLTSQDFDCFAPYMTLNSPFDEMPDLLGQAGDDVVSHRFREEVEKLEPNLHQFKMIDVRTKDGDSKSNAMNIMNVWQEVDAVIKVKPEDYPIDPIIPMHGRDFKWDDEFECLCNRHGYIILQPQAVQGRHLFYEPTLKALVVSTELFVALKRRKVCHFSGVPMLPADEA